MSIYDMGEFKPASNFIWSPTVLSPRDMLVWSSKLTLDYASGASLTAGGMLTMIA